MRLPCANFMFTSFLDLCVWHMDLLTFIIYIHLTKGDRVTEDTGEGGNEMIANVYLEEFV